MHYKTFLHILLKLTINLQMHCCDLAERKPGWDGIVVVWWARSRGWEEGVGDGWVGRREFHLPSHWGCCFPVECPLTPLHLTSSSHCDTVTLAVSWHTHASCSFPAVSAECASHFHTPGAQDSAQQQKRTMTEKQTQFISEILSCFRICCPSMADGKIETNGGSLLA